VALLGLPDDTGVRLNFGRVGARAGPSAFREALGSFGTDFDALARRTLSTQVFDAGDVVPAPGHDEAALFETHARVEAAARELHAAGLVVIGIGGGHDLSLPSLRAYSRHLGQPLGGINLDAHLDVRERVGSGMPFRRLIEGGELDPAAFVELGLGRFANERADFEWLSARGAELLLADTVLAQGLPCEALLTRALGRGAAFVSIDLDGIDAAFAPGVSARNPLGLRVEHASALAEAAGASPGVGHFDLMELCPPHDVDARTARVAAYLFLAFISGLERRPT
jgi:formiminoglutamase